MNAACWQVYETCWPLVVHALGAVIERHHVYDIHELYAQSNCCVPVVFLLPQTSAAHQTPERCSTMGLHCDLVVLSTACTIWLFKPMQPLFSFGVVPFLAGQHYLCFFSSREECEILQSLRLSVSLFVCLSVCLCPLGYLKNHTSKLHKMLHTCYVWPWLNPPLMTVQCVMYFQFCR